MDLKTRATYAGKIVSKQLMMKNNQKDKMTQEITIHKSLNHVNVVRFLHCFDDSNYVYIVLELCKQHSMMELHKRRPHVTDYECRFYIHQILNGVRYLHDNRIIHRDLKLSNLLLNDELNVKIADFGLATRIEYDGERKKTLCGTPNYIAPEILAKKGHSYEVDIWSIGCVMFTLLVGQPPFETRTLKDTYSRIKRGEYRLPQSLSKSAAEMIMAMLQSDPMTRPTVHACAKYPFLTNFAIPKSLPISCLECEPRLDQLGINHTENDRRPLYEINGKLGNFYFLCSGHFLLCSLSLLVFLTVFGSFEFSPCFESFNCFFFFGSNLQRKFFLFLKIDTRSGTTFLQKHLHDPIAASCSIPKNNKEYKMDIDNLYAQLTELLKSKPTRRANFDMAIENTDPSARPNFWISKWVDYSDKYGFGYQLCDEGMGIMFNDTTKLIMLANGM